MDRYPPTSGPITGPMNGAALNAAMGTPRSSDLHRSANVPPTKVIGALKAIPSMARAMRRVWMFGATAAGITNITAIARVLAYIRRRPRTSLRGANTMGPVKRSTTLAILFAGHGVENGRANRPNPKPTTNSVTLSRDTSFETLNCFETPAMSAVTTLLLNATTKQVKATTMVQYHL